MYEGTMWGETKRSRSEGKEQNKSKSTHKRTQEWLKALLPLKRLGNLFERE
jgi:hypothetical protein